MKSLRKIIGGLMLLWNGYDAFRHLQLFYWYTFTDIDFAFMIPYPALFIRIFIGLIGVIIGFQIIRERLNLLKWVIIDLLLISIALLIEYISLR